jgi:hypothetical protein
VLCIVELRPASRGVAATFAPEAAWDRREQAGVLSFDAVGRTGRLVSVWQALALCRRFLCVPLPDAELSLCFWHRAVTHAHGKIHQRKQKDLHGNETFGADGGLTAVRVRNLDQIWGGQCFS